MQHRIIKKNIIQPLLMHIKVNGQETNLISTKHLVLYVKYYKKRLQVFGERTRCNKEYSWNIPFKFMVAIL